MFSSVIQIVGDEGGWLLLLLPIMGPDSSGERRGTHALGGCFPRRNWGRSFLFILLCIPHFEVHLEPQMRVG